MANNISPKHIVVTTEGTAQFAKKKKMSMDDAYLQSFTTIKSTIRSQIRHDIPILTFAFGITKGEMINGLDEFLISLSKDEIVNDNQVKISFLGKWYDLPGRIVDAVKNAIEETKDYDRFFVNFCLNYDGQEEIVDACRMIARQIKAERIEPELITKSTVKDNLYSSYFIAPDLIIKNGPMRIPDTLLWDHVGASIFFTKKLFPELGKDDLEKAIRQM